MDSLRTVLDANGYDAVEASCQFLELFFFPITELRWVAEFPQLTSLALIGQPSVALAPLASASLLSRLEICEAGLRDVAAIGQCASLTHLFLWENVIRDPAPLSALAHLQVLSLQQNKISSLAFLKGLTKLEVLDLSWNPITADGFLALKCWPRALRSLSLEGVSAATERSSLRYLAELSESLEELSLEGPMRLPSKDYAQRTLAQFPALRLLDNFDVQDAKAMVAKNDSTNLLRYHQVHLKKASAMKEERALQAKRAKLTAVHSGLHPAQKETLRRMEDLSVKLRRMEAHMGNATLQNALDELTPPLSPVPAAFQESFLQLLSCPDGEPRALRMHNFLTRGVELSRSLGDLSKLYFAEAPWAVASAALWSAHFDLPSVCRRATQNPTLFARESHLLTLLLFAGEKVEEEALGGQEEAKEEPDGQEAAELSEPKSRCDHPHHATLHCDEMSFTSELKVIKILGLVLLESVSSDFGLDEYEDFLQGALAKEAVPKDPSAHTGEREPLIECWSDAELPKYISARSSFERLRLVASHETLSSETTSLRLWSEASLKQGSGVFSSSLIRLCLDDLGLKDLDFLFSASLVHLEELSASGNLVECLPSALGTMRSLKALDLSGNQLTKLAHLPAGLLELDVCSNDVAQLSPVTACPLLRTLCAADNRIAGRAQLALLSKLDSLSVLRLEGNPVGEVAELADLVLRSCPAMRLLNGALVSEAEKSELRQAAASTLSAAFLAAHAKDARRQHSLELSRLGFKRIQLRLNLLLLVELNLSGNQLASLGDAEDLMPALKTLSLAGNRIRSVATGRGAFPSLIDLSLCFNDLRDVSRLGLELLPRLAQLDLSNNVLETLDGLPALHSLRRLAAAKNRLHSLCSDFGRVGKLRSLDVGQNRLTSLPELGALERLEELRLTGNQLHHRKHLEALAGLPSLASLRLAGNKVVQRRGFQTFLVGLCPGLREVDGERLARRPVDGYDEEDQAREEPKLPPIGLSTTVALRSNLRRRYIHLLCDASEA